MVLYQAPLVIVAVFVVNLYRAYCHDGKVCGIQLKKRKIDIKFRYWTFLLAFVIVLNVVSVQDMMDDIMAQSGWLDPEITEKFVNDSLSFNDELDTSYKEWFDEASLKEYNWLRWFSIFSPFWILATLVACTYHIWTHVVYIQKAEDEEEDALARGDQAAAQTAQLKSQLHDMTILILFLPLFYSTMSYKSVMRIWQVCIDHVGALGNGNATAGVHKFGSFSERKDFLLEMYEANFMVADVYETFALVVFARLVTRVLGAHVKDAVGFSTAALGGTGANKNTDMRSARLFLVMSQQMLTSVKWFNWTCLTQAFYQCLMTQLGLLKIAPQYTSSELVNGTHVGSLQQPATVAYLATLFMGMGLVSSFVAIGAIMNAEGEFHEQLHHFKPSGKFWGTKILVSIAFMQSLVLKVLPPFSHYTETRVNLFYSSLLTVECFAITLLHLVAWGAEEEWYNEVELPQNLREYLLDHE